MADSDKAEKMLARVNRAIYLAMQLREFGHWETIPGDEEPYFVTTSSQLAELGNAADKAAINALKVLAGLDEEELQLLLNHVKNMGD